MKPGCWKCRQSLDGIEKVLFRTTCIHCGADLHVCVNCRHYSPGKPNDCVVPGTEFVRDREAANFCEDFALRSASSSSLSKEDRIAEAKKRLFGD